MPGNWGITSSPNRKQEQQTQLVPFVRASSATNKIQHFLYFIAHPARWLKLHGEARQDVRFAAAKAFHQTESAAGCDSPVTVTVHVFSFKCFNRFYVIFKFTVPFQKMFCPQKSFKSFQNCMYPGRKWCRREPDGTVNKKKHNMFMQTSTFSWCF